MNIIFIIVSFALGAVISWLVMRIIHAEAIARLNSAERSMQELKAERDTKMVEVARLTAMLSNEKQLSDKFSSIAAQVLRQNSEDLMKLADEKAKTSLQKGQHAISELVSPIRDALQRLEKHSDTIEKGRIDAYAELRSQVTALRGETANLSRALRTPSARGKWGELQLRRVVEISGMQEHCDFYQQESSGTEDGKQLRPDMIIRLCGGRNIVVDAKAPIDAYLDVAEAADETTRKNALSRHARLVNAQVESLGKKEYWKQFETSPDFVVLFLPGENFFAAALEVEPALIEKAWEKRVLLATPTTLIALLRSAAHGWKEEKLAENAREISERSAELYKRLCTFTDFLKNIGTGLEKALGSYNSAVRSFETRLLPQAKRCYEKHADAKMQMIEEPELINTVPQKIECTAEIALHPAMIKEVPLAVE